MFELNIRFGLHLDGERGWRAANRLAEPVMGPMSLLSLIETQLGLAREFPGRAERIVRFRECLKLCDSPSRFYHETFRTDELGTAARLLDWRDSWHLHGWSGKFGDGAGRRLSDMAEVEEVVVERVADSVGERLQRVAEVLKGRNSSFPLTLTLSPVSGGEGNVIVAGEGRIEKISLVDPVEAFPKRWREVLEHFLLEEGPPPVVEGEATLLGQLQAALRRAHGSARPDKIPWREDGSLRVVRAETRMAAAQWVAAELRDSAAECVLVAENEGALLDIMLDASDCARHGFRDHSAFRPALQVAPLALQTLWEPLDFHALLKFLTHPVSPLPRYARAVLAAELAERPGIGGARWKEAVEEIAAHYGDEGKSVREAIRFWIEHARCDPGSGASIEVVRERVRRLAEYFSARMAKAEGAEGAHFAAACAQVNALAANLDEWARQGERTIRPGVMQSLLVQATGRGAANPWVDAEVGAFPAVANPAAVIEPFDRVIWWQLGAPGMPQRYPWSRAEMRALTDAGAELPPFESVLSRMAAECLRPVLAARKELVLVLPPAGEEVHPLWLIVESLLERVPVEPVERVLSGAAANADLAGIHHRPLPQRRRWWQLPQDVSVPPRTRESYSSLEIAIHNPYQWVLKYPARLKPSSLLAVSGDFLLYGNLAHRMIERFYRQEDALSLSAEAIEGWFERACPEIIREEGAVLLMRGRRADLVRLRARVKHALLELRKQLAAARVAKVEPEKALAGRFVGGELAGAADLVVAKAGGEQAILDVKWSGARKYSEKLAETRHLQLAVYGELLRQGAGAWPHVAYLVLDQARLMAPAAGFFPEARVVPSRDGESVAALWERFVASWKWRRAQLDRGLIEVVLEGIEETEESAAPEDALAVEFLDPRYNDYLLLAGVEEQ